MRFRLFDFDYIKSLSFSPDKEYVITGHTEIAPLFEKADYITEFKKSATRLITELRQGRE